MWRQIHKWCQPSAAGTGAAAAAGGVSHGVGYRGRVTQTLTSYLITWRWRAVTGETLSPPRTLCSLINKVTSSALTIWRPPRGSDSQPRRGDGRLHTLSPPGRVMAQLNGVAWRGLAWRGLRVMPAVFPCRHITRRLVKETGGPADIRRRADGRTDGLVYVMKCDVRADEQQTPRRTGREHCGRLRNTGIKSWDGRTAWVASGKRGAQKDGQKTDRRTKRRPWERLRQVNPKITLRTDEVGWRAEEITDKHTDGRTERQL